MFALVATTFAEEEKTERPISEELGE